MVLHGCTLWDNRLYQIESAFQLIRLIFSSISSSIFQYMMINAIALANSGIKINKGQKEER